MEKKLKQMYLKALKDLEQYENLKYAAYRERDKKYEMKIFNSYVDNDNELKYRICYKKTVVEPIIKLVESNLEYFPEMGMENQLYQKSKLSNCSRKLKTSDLIEGKYKNYNLKWSFFEEILEIMDEPKDTFKGIMVCCEFANDLNMDVKIVFDNTELVGSLDNNYQKFELESKEFEKDFDVYTNNRINAFQFLTFDVMEKMLEFKNLYGYHYCISIVENKLYVRFNYMNSRFEPRFGDSVYFSEMEKIYDIVRSTINISKYFADTIN